MNRIFHSECLFVGLSNIFCVFFLFHLLLYFLFSCFIHFCSLFIQSCFSLLTILILIVYCLLYFPTNYHSLMIIYVSTLLCLFILVVHVFLLFLVHVILFSLVVVHPFSLTISSCSSFKYLPNTLLFVALALALEMNSQ
jgi:hypothetical protein